MQNYINFVELLAREGQDKVFFNSGPNHAAVVMSRIFKYSNDIVRIYCGGFNGTVSNDEEYLTYLQCFLERKGKVYILAQNDYTKSQGKIFKVLNKYKDQVEMYLTSSRVTYTTTKKSIHFTVGDQKMLRVETGIDDYTAQVNFGNEKDAKRFITVFDELLEKSKDKHLLK
jgi:hypothetical protein